MAKRRRWGSARGRRQALKRNQIAALILHGSLTTTEAKAKGLKKEVERLISRAKRADLLRGKAGLAARRRILAFLPGNQAAKRFFDQVVPQFSAKGARLPDGQGSASGGKGRVGGYVRVVKLPPRRGDFAPMARVEFVEKIAEAAEEKKRGATRKGEEPVAAKVEKKGKKPKIKEKPKVKSGSKRKQIPRESA